MYLEFVLLLTKEVKQTNIVMNTKNGEINNKDFSTGKKIKNNLKLATGCACKIPKRDV